MNTGGQSDSVRVLLGSLAQCEYCVGSPLSRLTVADGEQCVTHEAVAAGRAVSQLTQLGRVQLAPANTQRAAHSASTGQALHHRTNTTIYGNNINDSLSHEWLHWHYLNPF